VEQLEDRQLLSTTIKVYPGNWVDTGVHMKTGQSVDITASGTCTGSGRSWGPDGFYLLGFQAYELRAKIGTDIEDIGSQGTALANADGELLLGITLAYEPHADDSKTKKRRADFLKATFASFFRLRAGHGKPRINNFGTKTERPGGIGATRWWYHVPRFFASNCLGENVETGSGLSGKLSVIA
jgi:hypothetical protein